MIERFIQAQINVFSQALNEIKSGKKRTHWMWYIFPQIAGLGLSMTSIFFSIKNAEEAKEYLDHPLLGQRLREISHALLELKTDNPIDIFGYTDALKLRSSMTLFDVMEPESIFHKVLMKFYNGEKDDKTLKILADQKKPINDLIAESLTPTAAPLNKPALVLMGTICGDIIGLGMSSAQLKRQILNFSQTKVASQMIRSAQ